MVFVDERGIVPPSEKLLVVELPHEIDSSVLAEKQRLLVQILLDDARGGLCLSGFLGMMFGQFVVDVFFDGAVLAAAAVDAVASLFSVFKRMRNKRSLFELVGLLALLAGVLGSGLGEAAFGSTWCSGVGHDI